MVLFVITVESDLEQWYNIIFCTGSYSYESKSANFFQVLLDKTDETSSKIESLKEKY